MEALDLAMTKDIHLIIIDVMMPRLDGLSAIMKIREKKNLPIIVLSAKSENSDKVIGLSMGADDYVTKPFNPMELVARVKSQLRRYTSLGDIHSSGGEHHRQRAAHLQPGRTCALRRWGARQAHRHRRRKSSSC